LGQHPNWFAMNLGFAVVPAFALAAYERNAWLKLGLAGAGLVVFLSQMLSGSRGGTFSILIAVGLVALMHPRFRRWAIAGGTLAAAAIVAVLLFEIGPSSRSYERIWVASQVVLGASVRESNWLVCWEMFVDTSGRGIGAGGYEILLAQYDWWLYSSVYTYPHGIFWGLMAHYGVVGIGVFTWFVGAVAWMMRDLTRRIDSERAMVAWAMAAAMLGYGAWSFFEFSYDEKPFWEFLALLTAMWWAVRREQEADTSD
jgi:O-antigen ligase